MSPRMEAAIDMAEKCWSKAINQSPQFVHDYLEHAEKLLLCRPIVMGDEFRSHCAKEGLFLPKCLHHNTWVSGVRALYIVGWIQPISKVTPSQNHNHMPEVTLWRSRIYGGHYVPFMSRQLSLL